MTFFSLSQRTLWGWKLNTGKPSWKRDSRPFVCYQAWVGFFVFLDITVRWEQIFLNEFVSLLWLRGKGYNCSNANSSSLSYNNNSDPAFGNCGLQKGSTDNKCIICSNSLQAKIEENVHFLESKVFINNVIKHCSFYSCNS